MKLTQTNAPSIDLHNRLTEGWQAIELESTAPTVIDMIGLGSETVLEPVREHLYLGLDEWIWSRGATASGTIVIRPETVIVTIQPEQVLRRDPPQRREWTARSRARIASLAALPGGWNGPGSEPPSGLAVSHTHMVLSALESEDLEPSRIVAESSGGLVIYFFAPPTLPGGAHVRFASLACHNDGDVVLTRGDRREPASRVEEVAIEGDGLSNAVAEVREFIGE